MERNKNQNREKIEWLNYWIEDADKDKERVILIGDSVTRDLRKKLNVYMETEYSIDLLAMSYSITDDSVLKELEHYFNTNAYKYKFILYQMGAHHGYHVKCVEQGRDRILYTYRTKEILTVLNRYEATVFAIGGTYENGRGEDDKNDVYNHNDEIEIRNQILKEISKEMAIPFLDLNREIDYNIVEYIDNCHFYEDCYEYIAGIIIEHFFPEIGYVSSNQIRTLKELAEKINSCKHKRVYIYGNGVKGKALKLYLQRKGLLCEGYIVSAEYADVTQNAYTIDKIKNEDVLLIVTPLNRGIWSELNNAKFDYISLSSNLYEYIKMDNEMP